MSSSSTLRPANILACARAWVERRTQQLVAEFHLRWHEDSDLLADLAVADEVFLTGNYSKVQPVIQVADTHYQLGPVATRARELYFEFAERVGGRKI